jgi:hypothetical protein
MPNNSAASDIDTVKRSVAVRGPLPTCRPSSGAGAHRSPSGSGSWCPQDGHGAASFAGAGGRPRPCPLSRPLPSGERSRGRLPCPSALSVRASMSEVPDSSHEAWYGLSIVSVVLPARRGAGGRLGRRLGHTRLRRRELGTTATHLGCRRRGRQHDWVPYESGLQCVACASHRRVCAFSRAVQVTTWGASGDSPSHAACGGGDASVVSRAERVVTVPRSRSIVVRGPQASLRRPTVEGSGSRDLGHYPEEFSP